MKSENERSQQGQVRLSLHIPVSVEYLEYTAGISPLLAYC